VYCNHFEVLEGRTSAEVVGLDLKLGDNKWKGPIEKAVQNENQGNIVFKEERKDKETMDYWV